MIQLVICTLRQAFNKAASSKDSKFRVCTVFNFISRVTDFHFFFVIFSIFGDSNRLSRLLHVSIEVSSVLLEVWPPIRIRRRRLKSWKYLKASFSKKAATKISKMWLLLRIIRSPVRYPLRIVKLLTQSIFGYPPMTVRLVGGGATRP